MVGRLLTGMATGLLLFGLVFGAAASLTTNSIETVGAVNATVAACDTDGIDLSFTDTGLVLADVVVGGIADACDGLDVEVTISGTTVSGTIAQSGDNNASVTLDFSGITLNLSDLSSVTVLIHDA